MVRIVLRHNGEAAEGKAQISRCGRRQAKATKRTPART